MSMKEFWIILQFRPKKRHTVKSNNSLGQNVINVISTGWEPLNVDRPALKLCIFVLTCSRSQTSWVECKAGWCMCQKEQNLQPEIKKKKDLFTSKLNGTNLHHLQNLISNNEVPKHHFKIWEARWSENYLKLSFRHKVGTEQGAGQEAWPDDEVLRLVEEGQRCLGLPLWHLSTGKGHNIGGKHGWNDDFWYSFNLSPISWSLML